MEPLSSSVKENIQVSEKTVEAVHQLAQILNVHLTPSQLAVCIGIIERGASFKAPSEAINFFSRQETSSKLPKTSHV